MKSKRSKTGADIEVEEDLPVDSLNSDIFNPEDFLSSNQKVSILSLDLLGKIYDLSKASENNGSLEDPLGLQTESLKPSLRKKKKKHQRVLSKAEAPVLKLITKNFDEDQIWEEVEIQNRFMYENLVTSVSKLLAFQSKSLVADGDSDVESISNDEDEMFPEQNSRGTGKQQIESQSEDFFESDDKSRKTARQNLKKYPKSVVDDQFFSLAQMTEHIERVEAEEQTRAEEGQNDDNSDEDEDSIDLFEDIPNEEEQEEGGDKDAVEYYYKDFFDPPLSTGSRLHQSKEGTTEEEEEVSPDDGDGVILRKKSVSFDLEKAESDDDDVDENENEQNSDGPEEEDDEEEDQTSLSKELGKKISSTLSTFEKRKQKIDDNIDEMENEALQPKSWHLLGESTGETRPENALLEEHLIYDHLIKPAPAITVETTMRLEDVIKQRIKDGAWDDVQRKVRPVEDPREYKKRLVLDAEKSKASLAEIYEKEYLDQKQSEDANKEEKEPEEHTKIKKELKLLFQKLDALSHFHFTPKQPPAEVKIISNAPSISIEETAGVSVSDANMLAPQEIEDHSKGSIKGVDERSETDRKRERRKKKKKQHLKRLQQEEQARMKGLGLKNIKLAKDIVKAQEKSGKHMEGYSTSQQSSKELKSSKAFFAKLQQNVSSHIDKIAKRKRTSGDNETNGKRLSAKKFKL